MTPSIGRIVGYTLSENDVDAIRDLRKQMVPPIGGNDVEPGQVYPAMIVRTWGDQPDSCVNLQVFLDGDHVYWATSRQAGTGPATFAWPLRVD